MESSLGQRLRGLRIARGWSQDQEAAAINTARGDRRAPVNRQQVSRWERGERTPRWETLRHIAAIHGVQLDHLTNDPPAELVGLTPQTEAMRRRDLLKLTSASTVGLVAGLGDVGSWERGAPGMLDWHRKAYPYLHPKRHLTILQESISSLERSLLDRSGSPSAEALHAIAEMHLLSGRISFFDLQDPVHARRHLALALHSSREGRNGLLGAAVLAHACFVYARLGDGSGARETLDLAIRQAGADADSSFLSWVHAVGAETKTWSEDRQGSLRDIAMAENLIAAEHVPESLPPWFDYYDLASFQGFAGNCLIYAGRPAAAREHLECSLTNLPRHRQAQHSVLHADVALTYAREGDMEAAVARLDRAFDSLDAKWYATGFSRVMGTWNELPDGARPQHLRDRIRDMTVISGLM